MRRRRIKLRHELAVPLAALQETARAIAEVQREAGLDVNPQQYVESFRPTLMDIIHPPCLSKVLLFLEPPRQAQCSRMRCEPGLASLVHRVVSPAFKLSSAANLGAPCALRGSCCTCDEFPMLWRILGGGVNRKQEEVVDIAGVR